MLVVDVHHVVVPVYAHEDCFYIEPERRKHVRNPFLIGTGPGNCQRFSASLAGSIVQRLKVMVRDALQYENRVDFVLLQGVERNF